MMLKGQWVALSHNTFVLPFSIVVWLLSIFALSLVYLDITIPQQILSKHTLQKNNYFNPIIQTNSKFLS